MSRESLVLFDVDLVCTHQTTFRPKPEQESRATTQGNHALPL